VGNPVREIVPIKRGGGVVANFTQKFQDPQGRKVEKDWSQFDVKNVQQIDKV